MQPLYCKPRTKDGLALFSWVAVLIAKPCFRRFARIDTIEAVIPTEKMIFKEYALVCGAHFHTLAQQGLDEGVEITIHHPLHVGGF